MAPPARGGLHRPALVRDAGHWSIFATASLGADRAPARGRRGVRPALVRAPRRGLAVVATVVAVVLVVYCRLTARTPARCRPRWRPCSSWLPATARMTPRPQLVSFVLLRRAPGGLAADRAGPAAALVARPAVLALVAVPRLLVLGVVYGCLAVVADRPGPSGRTDGARSGWLRWPSVCGAVVAAQPGGPAACSRRPFEVSQTTQYIAEWARPSITAGPAAHGDGDGGRRGGRLGRAAPRARPGSPPSSWSAPLSGSGTRSARSCSGPLVAAPLFAGALPTLVGTEPGRPGPGDARAPSGRAFAGVAVALLAVAAVVVPHTADRRATCRRRSTRARPAAGRHAGLQRLRRSAAGSVWRHPDLEQYIDGLITPYSAQHVDDYGRESAEPGWYASCGARARRSRCSRRTPPLAAGLKRQGWRSRAPTTATCCSAPRGDRTGP